MHIDRKLLLSIACIFALFLLLSAFHPPSCSDCLRSHGWPLPYYREGGFLHDGHRVCWGGMLGDAFLILTCSVPLWMLLNATTSKAPLDTVGVLIRRRSWGWVRMLYGWLILFDMVLTVQRYKWKYSSEPPLRQCNSDVRGDTRSTQHYGLRPMAGCLRLSPYYR